MSLIIPANSASAAGGYAVDNSVRFDGSSSFSISQGNTNRRTFTISAWVKRSDISGGAGIVLLNSYASSSDYTSISLNNDGRLNVNSYLGGYPGGDDQCYIASNALYRDIGAWYHFCVGIDTTNGTTSERQKLWVNGERLTSFQSSSNLFSQNAQTKINSGATAYIQKNQYAAAQKSSYMSEVCFIDGQQLDADQFAEYDEDSGIWKPKDVSGLTFGTNGFYLEFKQSGTSQNSSGLGADTSGNDNHFAVNNLTAIDQSTDTCTNNFATLNPLNANIGATVPTLSEGNLRTSNSITNKMQTQYSTLAPSTGKFYCEVKATAGSVFRIGISSYNSNQAQGSSDTQNRPGQFSEGWGYDKTGTIYKTESSIATYTAYNTGDIICIALDMTNKKLYFKRNANAWENSANPATGSNGIDISSIPSGTGMAFGAGLEAGSVGAAYADFNFGSPPYAISSGNTDGNGYGNFEYAVPSGYYALNTKNLSEYG